MEDITSNLDQRFFLITQIPASNGSFPNQVFFIAIHDYIDVVESAIKGSKLLHTFDHIEHDKFEKEVCEKIMNDNSIPENERYQRVIKTFPFHFAPSFDALCSVHEKIEEMQKGSGSLHSLPGTEEDYRNFLRKIHPDIISILKKEMNSEVKPIQKENRDFLSYDVQTGVGIYKDRRFKFKINGPRFLLFRKLYENPGILVKKEEIWTLFGHNGNTIFINNLSVELRKKTGLNKNELVLSDSGIILAKKLINSSIH